MSSFATPGASGWSMRASMLNKVPEVILAFWIIKILCTTVGETFADYLNTTLDLGLTITTVIVGALLIGALAVQIRLSRYVAAVYWLVVVLTSIVGTLITDNLTDEFGVPLEVTAIVFSVILAMVFAVWFLSERTLSIHSIRNRRREAWYWLAILFTFALGTAAGDLVAERLEIGYLNSLILFGGLLVAVAVAYLRFHLNAVLAFWIGYILTRPLGASIGDLLSQPADAGGLDIGTTQASAVFLVVIVALVLYLTITKADVADGISSEPSPSHGAAGALTGELAPARTADQDSA